MSGDTTDDYDEMVEEQLPWMVGMAIVTLFAWGLAISSSGDSTTLVAVAVLGTIATLVVLAEYWEAKS